MNLEKSKIDALVEQGLVKKIPDPHGYPMSIYNYTFQATISKEPWSDELRACRGLVMGDDGTIYARPMKKFFNLDEKPHTKSSALPKDEVPQLSEKMDGSLIIVFWSVLQKKWRAITRGSWTSDQANWVNEYNGPEDANYEDSVIDEVMRLGQMICPSPAYTYCFELIANWNRIVVCYTTAGKLVFLARIENDTGKETDYKTAAHIASTYKWDYPRFVEKPLDQVDLNIKFNNNEGYVACYSNGLRVKLKFKEYLNIHRIVTGLSVKGIWEMLKDNVEVDLNNLPDEFLKYYHLHRSRLTAEYEKRELAALRTYVTTDMTLSRKEKALIWKDSPHTTQFVCFALLDKRDYSEGLWKAVKPDSDVPFRSED